jgi:hypothetical protein
VTKVQAGQISFNLIAPASLKARAYACRNTGVQHISLENGTSKLQQLKIMKDFQAIEEIRPLGTKVSGATWVATLAITLS